MKKRNFYVLKFLKDNFERIQTTIYHNFDARNPSIITLFRLQSCENVSPHILTPLQSLWTQNTNSLSRIMILGKLTLKMTGPVTNLHTKHLF